MYLLGSHKKQAVKESTWLFSARKSVQDRKEGMVVPVTTSSGANLSQHTIFKENAGSHVKHKLGWVSHNPIHILPNHPLTLQYLLG